MNKYINIILFSFFGIISIKLNLGLALFIPYLVYYIYINRKNIFLILPLSILSMLYFKIEIYLILLFLYIPIIFMTVFMNKLSKTYIYIISLITNIITYLIYRNAYSGVSNIYLLLISIIICPVMTYFLINSYNNNNPQRNIHYNAYNEILLGTILVLSTINYEIFNVSIAFLLAILYSLYFSYNDFHIYSIVYSCVITIILKSILGYDYTWILLILSLIGQVKKIPKIIASLPFYLYLLLYKITNIPSEILYYVLAINVTLEILYMFTHKVMATKIIQNFKETTYNQVDKELQGFSLFLDKMSEDIKQSESNEELAKGIEKIAETVCLKCDKRIECYQRNKGKLYYFFKNSILGNESNMICEHSEEVKRNARLVRYNIRDKKEYINDLMNQLLNGVSNIIKQYTVEHSKETEIDIGKIYDLKEGIIKNGYTISLYNIERTLKNNFLIELGLVGITFDIEREKLQNIASYYLGEPATINRKYIKNNKVYITIIPRLKYEITYGYGSVSKIGNSICGDNYCVKNMSNRKFIAAICDGMGKGLHANLISNKTLKLLDQITNEEISCETSIQILNTLYYMQDYEENYTTLDFVEIDKIKGELTLYKAGAAMTYIIHENNEIEKIENSSLPFGLNELILTKKIKLLDNDLILIGSDGIFDNIIDYENFENFIKLNRKLDPQKIAYEILNYARHSEVFSKDDMSIIALKVNKV